MKITLALLALAFATYAQAKNTCEVQAGTNQLVTNGGKPASLDFPCKYAAVRQQCGNYHVRISPGNVYVSPRFFINTIWVEVSHTSGKDWEGRTSSKIAAKYINDAGITREALIKKAGSYSTNSLFTISKGKSDFTAAAHDGAFSITFGPYDAVGALHNNVHFKFTCNIDGPLLPFPNQICGGDDPKDVQYVAEALQFKTGQNFKSDTRDKTYYFAVFNDTSTDQSPTPKCQEAVDTFVNVCPNDAKRVEAIEVCHTILYSLPHRECAIRFSCAVIDVFASCLKFVCSDYKDKDACQEVGDAIDMCRDYPGLTGKIQGCYIDLFVNVDKNSVVY